MGWCQEFGLEIHEGCGHAMAANVDRCSCAECGTVCRGKFAGCATVWAAGPVNVTFRRPMKELGFQHDRADLSGTNGNARPTAPHEIVARSGDATTQIPGDLVALIQTLRSEIQLLNQKLERGQDRAAAAEEAAKAASQVAEELPRRIGGVLSAALQQQRQAVLTDLAGLRTQVAADVERLANRLAFPATSALQADIVSQIDIRFEWLVDEISNRLVLLGNEVARINEQASPGGRDQRSAQAAPRRLLAPS